MVYESRDLYIHLSDMKKMSFYVAIAALWSAVPAMSESGLVSIPVACLRSEPRSGAELTSQAVMGTPLSMEAVSEEWWKVTTPDGYEGYMTSTSVVPADTGAWNSSTRYVVGDIGGTVIFDARGKRLSPLPCGSIVEVRGGEVVLPDGRRGYISPDAVTPYDRWRSQTFDPARFVASASELAGAPYLWGGMSPQAMDCSGLVRICFLAQGRLTGRDAWQQALEGEEVAPDSIRPGDLVFYDRTGSGRINHVAIYVGNGRLIHCSGYVRENALASDAPDVLTGRIMAIRRVSGRPFTPLWDGATR